MKAAIDNLVYGGILMPSADGNASAGLMGSGLPAQWNNDEAKKLELGISGLGQYAALNTR